MTPTENRLEEIRRISNVIQALENLMQQTSMDAQFKDLNETIYFQWKKINERLRTVIHS